VGKGEARDGLEANSISKKNRKKNNNGGGGKRELFDYGEQCAIPFISLPPVKNSQ